MQTSVETLSPTRVRLTVEVPFEELEPAVRAAYKKIGGQVRIQGFRPGKVPPQIIDQRVGRGTVLDEAVQSALPTFYSTAVRENEVAVLSQPEVDVTDFVDREKLVFTAEVDVRPELALPAYGALQVQVEDADVTDDDIDADLAGLQDRFSTLSGVDRAVQDGDFVSLDLVAKIDGELVPGGEATGMSYEVGSDTMLPGLDEAITGLSDGEETTFDSALVAGDHAGQIAQVTVTVRSVKTKEVPPLDDDFAQTASEFDTIAELRDDVRTRLERTKKLEQGVAARDETLETMLRQTEIAVPDSVVVQEVAYREQSIDAQLEQAGLTKEAYLASEGRTEEDLAAELRESAEDAVKAQLLLDAIAEKEEVQVSDAELTEQVVRRAQRAGVSPDAYAQQVVQSQQLGALMAEVRRGKTLAQVLESTTITDASGRRVDLEALRETAGGESDEQVDEDGRRFHTHPDGTVHYLDDESDAAAPEAQEPAVPTAPAAASPSDVTVTVAPASPPGPGDVVAGDVVEGEVVEGEVVPDETGAPRA